MTGLINLRLKKVIFHLGRHPKTAVVMDYLHYLLPNLFYRLKPWEKDRTPGFVRRAYKNYSDYITHQKSKAIFVHTTEDCAERQAFIKDGLTERLSRLEFIKPGLSVLCLGAMSGGEVEAFFAYGCFAVGIDIHPVPSRDNLYVLYGDFQQLQFPDSCVDLVYTNSLDHAFDLRVVAGEVCRVLKPGGIFYCEAVKGFVYEVPREFESVWWENIEHLICLIEKEGLKLLSRNEVGHGSRWNQFVFAKGR